MFFGVSKNTSARFLHALFAWKCVVACRKPVMTTSSAASFATSSSNAAVPQPFCAATSNATYAIFSERNPGAGNKFNMRWLTRNRNDRLAERMQLRPPGYGGTGWPGVFAHLRDAGVTASETGLELAAGRPLHNDSALAAALSALSFTDDAKHRNNHSARKVSRARSNAQWSRLIWAADAPILQNLTSRPPQLPPAEHAARAVAAAGVARRIRVRPRLRAECHGAPGAGVRAAERAGRKTADGELVTARRPSASSRCCTTVCARRGIAGRSARTTGTPSSS